MPGGQRGWGLVSNWVRVGMGTSELRCGGMGTSEQRCGAMGTRCGGDGDQ